MDLQWNAVSDLGWWSEVSNPYNEKVCFNWVLYVKGDGILPDSDPPEWIDSPLPADLEFRKDGE